MSREGDNGSGMHCAERDDSLLMDKMIIRDRWRGRG
jgi:hypothetical protein